MFHARTSGQAVTGELAPDFVLDGSEGKPVKLSSLRGRWMLLIFAERKEDVAPFRRVHAQIDSSGVRMAAVCAEKGYVVENYVRREKLPFLIMADFSREVCDMYGLVEGPATVMPGYLLINPKGEIVMTMLGQSLPPEDVARLAIYVAGRQ